MTILCFKNYYLKNLFLIKKSKAYKRVALLMLGGKDLGRLGEEMLPRKQLDKKQYSPLL